MAVGNRTETKAAVTAALVPTLELSDHITLLNDSVNESVVFRKDIIAVESPIGAALTIDYSNKDTATATISVNTTISFTNIENGDVKYLSVAKGATNTVAFSGATDVSSRKGYINLIPTLVVYQVFNKNGNIYVNCINLPNNNNSESETIFVNLPFWDMEFSVGGTTFINVAHGIASGYSKIKSVFAKIINDAEDEAFDFVAPYTIAASQYGGLIKWDNTNVSLIQNINDGSFFDSNDFDSAALIRGELEIVYVP